MKIRARSSEISCEFQDFPNDPHSDAVSLDSEGSGAAVVAGVGSNLTQPRGISYFSLYIFFSEVLASVMILGRNSFLKFV